MRTGSQILKSTSVISFFTGISRVLGLVREILMANFFGTTLARSAFDIAFRIPNLFRAVLGEGALNAAFVPLLTEVMEKEGEKKAARLASSIITLVGALLMVVVGLGLAVLLGLSSFDLGEKWNAVVSLSMITLPYVLFICLAALCMGVFHSRGKFWVSAASQGLLNVVWIFVLSLMFSMTFLGTNASERIYSVAWAVIIAGAVQLAFQAVFLKKQGFNPSLSFDWAQPRVKRFLLLMAPVVLGSGITQINVFISSILAMSIGDWAPAALGYADRLIYLPVGLFAAALGSVLLPTFSRQATGKKQNELAELLKTSIRNICLVTAPIAAAIFALALPLVILIFKAGEFDEISALLTMRALMAYAPGLVAFSIYKTIVPAFYAMQDTRTPVIVAICAALTNLMMNILSVLFLPEGYQHVGMAGSIVLTSFLSSLVLLIVMSRRIDSLKLGRTLWSVVSIMISGIIMAFVCARTYNWFAAPDGGKILQFFWIICASAAGLAVYMTARIAVDRVETIAVLKAIFKADK